MQGFVESKLIRKYGHRQVVIFHLIVFRDRSSSINGSKFQSSGTFVKYECPKAVVWMYLYLNLLVDDSLLEDKQMRHGLLC